MDPSQKSNLSWPTLIRGLVGSAAILAALLFARPTFAQAVHYLQRGDSPPGVVGQQQLLARASLIGYIQPVRVIAPEGASIAFWDGVKFSEPQVTSATIAMQIGAVYRLKITNIPRHEGVEIFPTIELINRLYPPQDKVDQFPVIVEIPSADLDQAVQGKLVTRIVYLENPETAMPYRQSATEQPYFDVRATDDPLQVAYQLGRAFAMVRLGSRIPDGDEAFNGLVCGILPEPPCDPDGCGCQSQPHASDEYICDGGDRNGKTIVAADWSVRGLDTQDTVVHFDTEDGKRIVNESNRVCIYSPRFAAVRQISGAVAADAIDSVVSSRRDVNNFEASQDQRSTTTLQNIQPRRNFNYLGTQALRDSTRGITADTVWAAKGMSRVMKPYEDFQIMRSGVVDNAENARLAIRIDAARSWDCDLHVQVAEGRVKPLVVRDALVPADFSQDGSDKRPKIQLCKVASTSYARPGDEVEFTIRFDNIGSELIGNVTVIDSLTTRLEFIPDSAQCSVKHEFKTETNSGDSQVLRWEITDPLEIGTGGIIRFRCRVR